MRSLLLALALSATLTGCSSTGKSDADTRLEHADIPDCTIEAREIEDLAIKEVNKGNKRIDEHKRLEHYERAIGHLQRARRLYEDELTAKPGSPDKQKAINREIDRLDKRIAELHRTKPAIGPGG